MPGTLIARSVEVHRGATVVLGGIDLTVAPGHRIGVVGPNGIGKTTFLRALAGLVPLDAGSVTAQPPTLTVGYLPQEPERSASETLLAFLVRRTGVADAQQALDTATAALAAGHPAAADTYDAALQRWLALGGADIEARAEEACADVGLPSQALEQPTLTLSGGQAARASLAAVLLSRFDVVLLDEPTNDLDLQGLARLERWAEQQDAGMVIVSHDRAFLERVVTEVLDLDERHRTGTLYGGGWLAYLDARSTARRHAEEAYATYTDQRSTLQSRAQREREWARVGVASAKRKQKDNDKIQRKAKVETTEQLAARAGRTERAIERLEEVDKPWEGWELRLDFAMAPRAGAVVARLDGAVVERGEFRLGPIDLEVGWGERVALLGPNGSGKSTLLDALLGRLPLASGERWIGPGVVVGELDQRRLAFDDAGGRSLLDVFADASGVLARDARTLLAKFGLVADHVLRPAASLSPGERTRAALALLMAKGTNWLVLDEPTNHLDLTAIEQLEQALGTWKGSVLLVTHDRRFLESLHVTRSIALAPRAGG